MDVGEDVKDVVVDALTADILENKARWDAAIEYNKEDSHGGEDYVEAN